MPRPPDEATVSRGASSKPGRVGDISLYVPCLGTINHPGEINSIEISSPTFLCVCVFAENELLYNLCPCNPLRSKDRLAFQILQKQKHKPCYFEEGSWKGKCD